MARRLRCSDGGYVYHVLNRAVGRATILDKSADYAALEKVLRQAWERLGTRLLAYVLLPKHWHLVLWPEHDGELSTSAQWLTVTHVRRWHAHHHTGGTGPLYQGRFKSFPVQEDDHFYTSAAMGSAIRSGPTWSRVPSSGAGRVCGSASMRPVCRG